jgi:predicted RNA-binding Zn ribbon-like protein
MESSGILALVKSSSHLPGLTGGPTLTAVQAAGFPMGGENLAIDLADTLVTVTTPPTDLIAGQPASDRFWTLHGTLLPDGWTLPDAADTRRLRDAIRNLLDAAQQGAALDPAALDIVNATSALARVSAHIAVRNEIAERRELWHYEDPADLALAAAARSAIDVLADPARRANLRRCASPTCSMLFVTGDARRRWCTPNICGNRDRVARHYRRRLKNQL